MTKRIKGIVSLSLTAFFSLSLAVGQLSSFADENNGIASAAASFTDVTGQVDMSEIQQANFNSSVMESETSTYGKKTVIVSLEGDSLVDGKADDQTATEYLSTASGRASAKKIEASQAQFLSTLSAKGIPYTVKNTYNTFDNAVAIEVDTSYVSKIKSISGVQSAVISRTYSLPETVADSTTTSTDSSSSTSATVNETQVYKTGIYDSSEFSETYNGTGMVVAILDTGLDYTHVAFQNQPDSRYLGLSQSDVKGLLAEKDFAAEARTSGLSVEDVYVSDKVPFAYDYSDDDADVYPSYSNHGTHVAGIVGGYSADGYTDKDGNHINEPFIGVAPDAQLVICKVFTDDLSSPDLGGAVTEDILAALEDCILLNVDVINMSLGSTAGFTTTDDGDDEGDYMNRVYSSLQEAGISLVAAASNDYSSAYGGTFGTNLASQPDSGTVGSPSTYSSALSVASISGQQSKYILGNPDASGNGDAIFYEESSDANSVPYDFAKNMLTDGQTSAEFEYVVVPGVGQASDYTATIRNLFKEKPGERIALIKRGTTNFQEKVEIAMEMGAKAVIIYNNVAGKIRMNLGDIDDPIPAISISLEAGTKLVNGATGRVGTIKIDTSLLAGPFMSDFSSWGPTPDLKLKPEITAHGGEITSTVPGGYDEQSGTSMASPNMAGVMALVRQYVQTQYGSTYDSAVQINRFANQLIMSTATTAYDEEGYPYSPRKQGAGLASLSKALSTQAYIYTDNVQNDYRPKIELGDDRSKKGEYTFSFNVANFGSSDLSFKTNTLFMTESEEKISSSVYAVAEQAHLLDDIGAKWEITDALGNSKQYNEGDNFTVKANSTVTATVTLKLSEAEREYIEQYFTNGMYVEGFCKLLSNDGSQCDLVIPFLGFYGDWDSAQLLDYDCFEVSAFQQDSQYTDETRPQAQVWATQAYTSYYNDQYVLPLGGYVYLLPEDDDPMYVERDHAAISRYNEYVSETGDGNYLTSTGIKAVYAGLLRNVRYANYTIYNSYTGEVLEADTINRIGKAFASGGSAHPAYIRFEVFPEVYNLVANGKYTVEFDFRRNADSEYDEENTFSFDFYVDYDAPTMQEVRVRYETYKEDNKEKQRIYLDVDVYDNHYAQSIMLCYLDNQGGEQVLQLATEYITPVRNAVKNGTTTVSIEITDIYEEYKDKLYLQVDDYALNHSTYSLNLTGANTINAPESFDIASEDQKLTLATNEAYKVNVSINGTGSVSNLTWKSSNNSVAKVQNGEIIGLKKGTARITASNGTLNIYIDVTVTDEVKTLSLPSISFGTIIDAHKSVAKASGYVEVNANQDFTLNVITDPWYYSDIKDLNLHWSSTDESIATVTCGCADCSNGEEEGGYVTCLKKGMAIIKAQILNDDGSPTLYSNTVTLAVQEEFTVSSFMLTAYGGRSSVVEIPDDMNIMYIGEEAFKDNDYITEVIIPKTVTQINEKAFYNCTALKKVTFSEDIKDTDSADLTLIGYRAFYNCTSLETIDLTKAKVITIGNYAFEGCTSLKTIINMDALGTLHDGAFWGCTSLTSVDLSGVHMSGSYVFYGCNNLSSVTTDKFTDIGDYMFYGCTGIQNVIIKTPNVGTEAFAECSNLKTVTFQNPVDANGDEEQIKISIGQAAFYNCSKLTDINFNNCTVIKIGDGAFGRTAISSFAFPDGILYLGESLFSGCTRLTEIVLTDNIDLTQLESFGFAFSSITVKIPEDSTVYKLNAAKNAIYDVTGKTLVKVLSAEGEFVFDEGVTAIAPYAFAGSKVTSVTIPYSVKSIGEGAFMNSSLATITMAYDSEITVIEPYTFYGTRINKIVLPGFTMEIGDYAFANSTITEIEFLGNTIGNYAFYRCTSLVNITLYDSIEVMGNRVFSDCTALQTVVMPSVKELGSYTFYNTPALKSVTFGQTATTAGEYTFYSRNTSSRSNLTSISLSNGITEIGSGLFYNCNNLAEINLKGATKINNYAFYGCTRLSTVTGIENVTEIGNYAFYNCSSLQNLNLTSAKTIGNLAFAIMSSGNRVYNQINIPAVEQIGEMAFYGGGESEVTLPASLNYVGIAAFNSSKLLTAINVENGNACYFDENGVLYRYITNETYEIVAYPTALVAETVDGLKTYEIKEGTITVFADAFSYLNSGAIEKVIFPYSIKTIGDEAFYLSGVTVYEFESIAAPVLETSYRDEIYTAIENTGNLFRGYYYSNFNDLFVNYCEFFNYTSELTILYPENGTGYNNYIYSLYFGDKITTGIKIDDDTREVISAIEALYDADVVSSWLNDSSNVSKAEVEAFSEAVKNARRIYGNVNDANQLAFIDNALVEKLTSVETALRSVKEKFGIAVKVSLLTYDASNCKTSYIAGEKFNPDGLIVTAIYDDGSTENLDLSTLTLGNTGELGIYDRYVEYKDASGNRVRVQITVTEQAQEHVCESVCEICGKCTNADCTEDACLDKCEGHEGGDDPQSGCNNAGASLIGALSALATVAVVLIVNKRKNARG